MIKFVLSIFSDSLTITALNKLKDILPQSKLRNVYHVLVKGNIRDADVVWGSVSPSEMSTLQSLQHRTLSIVKALKSRISGQLDG